MNLFIIRSYFVITTTNPVAQKLVGQFLKNEQPGSQRTKGIVGSLAATTGDGLETAATQVIMRSTSFTVL